MDIKTHSLSEVNMAGATVSCKSPEVNTTDPPYIRYLFAPTTKYTVFFIVGDPALGEAEKIGACKLKLMAHSDVFRKMLEESPLAEEGDVKIPNIQPDIFRHLLRFMYGHNSVPTLTLEDAVDLLHAAEEYMIDELKDRLASHISPLLSVDKLFLTLNYPVCFQQLTLKNTIDKIIQEKTKALLSNPNFLDLNQFGIQRILVQEELEVTEIELWRELLRWAQHNTRRCTTYTGTNRIFQMPYQRSNIGKKPVPKLHVQPSSIVKTDAELQSLRDLLSESLKYIRFCTMSWEDFTKEVVLTGILTDYEITMINRTYGSKIKQTGLTTVCNEIQMRELAIRHTISSPFGISNAAFGVSR